MKKRIVVVCPGRGTYAKENLRYFRQQFQLPLKTQTQFRDYLHKVDLKRSAMGELTLSHLDEAEQFTADIHTRGENASSLILACSYLDFLSIDRERYEIVAITGNSMGWYLSLAFAGALSEDNAFTLVNTMGSMMKEQIIGGQIVYPICDDQWRISDQKIETIETALAQAKEVEGAQIYDSIYLGGMIVFGANEPGLRALSKALPAFENYPLRLINHAAFHTPLLKSIAIRAFTTLGQELFSEPKIPLIDGRGSIWQPYSTYVEDLYNYTLGHQVVEPYDFTRAITVALKEFSPDALVLLGPGSNLGGSLGQILIHNNWLGVDSKARFLERQAQDPFVLAMGRLDQRQRVALAP